VAGVTGPERSGVFAVSDPDPQLPTALAALGLATGDDHVQRFEPQGTSWIRRSGSSWIALHTWPEQALVTADTYGPAVQPVEVLTELGWRPADRPLEFTAGWSGGRRLRYRLARVLERVQSDAGELVLGESPDLGLAVFADRALVLCARDMRAWHRALALPALAAHPAPREVLIVAVGTGGLVAQVLAWPGVVRIHLVPRSPDLVALAREHLRDWHHGALDDPRVTVGAQASGPFDVVLADQTLDADVGSDVVVCQPAAGTPTHGVALPGAGLSRPLQVSHPPRSSPHLPQGLWDRWRALG
jgi:hypothetical protein